jgi:hypothetical protein
MSTPGQMSLFASAASIFPPEDLSSAIQEPVSTLVATGMIPAGSVPTVTVSSSVPVPMYGVTPLPVVHNADMSGFPANGAVFVPNNTVPSVGGQTAVGWPANAWAGSWQTGITPPNPEMDHEQRRLGCTKCQAIKPAPKSPYALCYIVDAITHYRSELKLGYCGQCGSELVYVECICKEPLHDEEMFCRNCGRNNAANLAKWGILDPLPTPEEEAARGQSSDETFRGEREV